MDRGIGDLRLRIEASFSASELRDLARKWSVSLDPTWDRSPGDFARGLLREAERSHGITEVVRRLRLEKPLVEWPDVESGDAEKWGPQSVTALGLGPSSAGESTLAGGFVAPTVDGETTVVGGPPDFTESAMPHSPAPASRPMDLGPLEGAPALAVPSQAPPVSSSPASLPAPSEGPPSADTVGPMSARGPASAPVPSAPFPGTVVPEPPKPRTSVDARLLIVVAGAMLGLGGLAFGAGLLWSSRSTADAPSSKQAHVANPNGLAGRAASVLDGALMGVADRCEIEVVGEPSVAILTYAQDGCGHALRESKRRALADDAPTPNEPRPRSDNTSDEPRSVRAPTQGSPSKPVCTSACASDKSSCMSSCGPEPSDASKFDVWQACSGRCLAAESRCRLSCR